MTRATNRDIPAVAVLTWSGECIGKEGWCVSAAGGAGLDFEHRRSESTFCEGLSCDPRPPSTRTRILPTLTGGLVFGTRLSPSVELQSDLRVWWVSRERDSGKGRGALYENRLVARSFWVEVGVSIAWRFRQH